MANKEKILKAIEESMEKLKTVDENIIGECIGVSHALGDLRKTLDKIDVCLDKRRYSDTNGLIRQYLPKRKSMASLTQKKCSRIALQLNTRPRERHDFRTPLELYQNNRSVALQT